MSLLIFLERNIKKKFLIYISQKIAHHMYDVHNNY